MNPFAPEERLLLDAVRHAPDDDGPRLVYADLLDEMGDPRGRFIRVQLALARLSPYEPRRNALIEEERLLFARYEAEWTASFRGLASGIIFRRGFVDEVKMTARQFQAHAAIVFDSAPIRHLHLLDAGQSLAVVLDSPLLSRLEGFSLYAQYLGGTGQLVSRLHSARTLTGLKRLLLGRNRLSDEDVRQLASTPLAESIETLDLRENDISDRGAEILAEKAVFAKLARLDLSHTHVGPALAASIASAAHRPVLQSLNLSGNASTGRITADNVALFRVAELDLSETGLTVLGLNRLLEAVTTPTARILRLSGNTLGDGGAESIAGSAVLANLRELDLRRNEIGDAGVEHIFNSMTLARLEHLDLTSNPIDPLGWAAILMSNRLTSLRRLDLPTAGISPNIREALDLKYNRLS
ncbi:MAG: TIGR02996 domain-containing protein [Gemmataceae bacterium]